MRRFSPRCKPRLRKSGSGFTYLGILALIVLIGLMLAMAGEVASTQAQREREAELLFIGHQYRDAIAFFYRVNHRFPQTPAELVQSADSATPVKYFLRRLYRDPMTGAADWSLIPAANGGFMGVASTSTRAPLKRAGFDLVDTDFDQAEKYTDWVFIYDPLPRFRGAAH
ncbi:MAG: type II secretion system protein [Proteobacteria bacterium]|nr:type II secretion system protein [Pseudomonadota bacterium]